ncbi:hypothetical protein K443DRAFT_8434 [Laccaria amethystina LaAM-08-1]|uniref:Tr-type G domain-containing protein n=1 Tax=Laccaria amethystina LaAM-08-1 TaxID=1095629 RepID=A0A0C9XP63_9AGAR|nr:hypothetical protein K443DRAFT_8434 [Laccaria amethystina LaAM-08-1]
MTFTFRWRFRFYSTLQSRSFATYDPSKIRNMALVAHIDSGKTTLTESILFNSSYLSSSGSVDTGSTTTDFLPVERERGITVQSASIPVKWKDWIFNLIDTPGHADFGMEVESASRVIDGAVVLIDSVEGVEAQTKGVWRQLDRYHVPTRIMFLNKMDRPGASYKSSFLSLLSNRLHPHPMALTLPIASFDPHQYLRGEPGIQGLVDLIRWNIWKWDKEGQASCHPLPQIAEDLQTSDLLPPTHPIIPHIIPARTQLLENLSMFHEDLMEHLLNTPSGPSAYLDIDSRRIIQHLRASTLRGEVLPVLCGSAIKNIGTDLLMDYVGELLASPLDVSHPAQGRNPPVRLLAWKVNWDKKRGWMTFVRVYSGTLTRQSVILNTNRNQREKVSKLLLLYASDSQEVDELPFGSVGVILGLKYTRTGDTLVSLGGETNQRSAPRDITPPIAVISASVVPLSNSDLEPVQEALECLVRTDPSVRVDSQEGQILVHGLGALHLQVVEGRLRDEWNVKFEFGQRRVSYREGLGSGVPQIGWNVWQSDVGGKHTSVVVPLKVRPMQVEEKGDPTWDGSVVIDHQGNPLPAPEASSDTLLACVVDGLANALSNSPHSSLAMSRIHIQINPSDILQSIPPSLITGATATVLRKRVRDAGPGPLMEPYVFLKISVNESSLGKVIKDLIEHGGQVLDLGEGSAFGVDDSEEAAGFPTDNLYIPPQWLSPSGVNSFDASPSGGRLKCSVNAIAPLSRFFNYSNRLRAMSEGYGTFEMVNAGFKEVSDARRMDILREIGRA